MFVLFKEVVIIFLMYIYIYEVILFFEFSILV